MSMSFNCKCPERDKPVAERAWAVSQRYCQHSAFNGYVRQFTDRSTVRCFQCLCIGRTKGKFVDQIPDAPANWHVSFKRMTRAELNAAAVKTHKP